MMSYRMMGDPAFGRNMGVRKFASRSEVIQLIELFNFDSVRHENGEKPPTTVGGSLSQQPIDTANFLEAPTQAGLGAVNRSA